MSCHQPPRLVVMFALLVVSLSAPVRAQVTSDPNDPLYTELEVWEAQGLLERLPAVQPYPLQSVRAFLERVAQHPAATKNDRARALFLLARLDEPFHVSLEGEARVDTAQAEPYLLSALDFDVQGAATPWLMASGRGRARLYKADGGFALPSFRGNPEDLFVEGGDIDVGEQKLLADGMSYGSIGFGEADAPLLFHMRFGRHRVGPFWRNGVVIGPQAPAAGSAEVLLQQPNFRIHLAVFELSATDDQGAGPRGTNKRLFYHSLEMYPLPWLDVGIFESVMSGGRFEFLYLLPASLFMSQGMSSFSDNSLLGGQLRARPLRGLELKALVYADDLDFNNMVRLNLDTKYKLAAQVGASVTPATMFELDGLKSLRLITLDYTAVMPYMYTHINSPGGFYNYENYTHVGENFGPALEPNSDRIELRALWRPAHDITGRFIDLEGRAALVRHGNASAGILPGADGSLFDSGWLDGVPTFQPPFEDPTGQPATRFLTQRVLETTIQLGLTARFEVFTGSDLRPVPDGQVAGDRGLGGLTLLTGLDWQWDQNRGFVEGASARRLFSRAAVEWRW